MDDEHPKHDSIVSQRRAKNRKVVYVNPAFIQKERRPETGIAEYIGV